MPEHVLHERRELSVAIANDEVKVVRDRADGVDEHPQKLLLVPGFVGIAEEREAVSLRSLLALGLTDECRTV